MNSSSISDEFMVVTDVRSYLSTTIPPYTVTRVISMTVALSCQPRVVCVEGTSRHRSSFGVRNRTVCVQLDIVWLV